jgi:hypothetical protein
MFVREFARQKVDPGAPPQVLPRKLRAKRGKPAAGSNPNGRIRVEPTEIAFDFTARPAPNR